MQAVALVLPQFNDVTLLLTLTNGVEPLNLTGAEVDVFLKTAAGVDDADPSTVKFSSSASQITITSASLGQASCPISHTLLGTSEAFTFWRCDVVAAGLRNTAMYGAVLVTRL